MLEKLQNLSLKRKISLLPLLAAAGFAIVLAAALFMAFRSGQRRGAGRARPLPGGRAEP